MYEGISISGFGTFVSGYFDFTPCAAPPAEVTFFLILGCGLSYSSYLNVIQKAGNMLGCVVLPSSAALGCDCSSLPMLVSVRSWEGSAFAIRLEHCWMIIVAL